MEKRSEAIMQRIIGGRLAKLERPLPFDDCPICQAVNAADAKGRSLSETELLAEFAKAKDQQKRKR